MEFDEKYGETYTLGQIRFCENYLINPNASWAYRTAGYSARTADSEACKLLALPKIQRYLAERRREIGEAGKVMPLDELLSLITKIARYGHGGMILRWADENEEIREWEPETTEDGRPTVFELLRQDRSLNLQPTVDLNKLRETGNEDLIKSIKYDNEGRQIVELFSRDIAIRLLTQYYGIQGMTSQEANALLDQKGYLK